MESRREFLGRIKTAALAITAGHTVLNGCTKQETTPPKESKPTPEEVESLRQTFARLKDGVLERIHPKFSVDTYEAPFGARVIDKHTGTGDKTFVIIAEEDHYVESSPLIQEQIRIILEDLLKKYKLPNRIAYSPNGWPNNTTPLEMFINEFEIITKSKQSQSEIDQVRQMIQYGSAEDQLEMITGFRETLLNEGVDVPVTLYFALLSNLMTVPHIDEDALMQTALGYTNTDIATYLATLSALNTKEGEGENDDVIHCANMGKKKKNISLKAAVKKFANPNNKNDSVVRCYCGIRNKVKRALEALFRVKTRMYTNNRIGNMIATKATVGVMHVIPGDLAYTRSILKSLGHSFVVVAPITTTLGEVISAMNTPQNAEAQTNELLPDNERNDCANWEAKQLAKYREN